MSSNPIVDYQTSPSQYKHIKLAFDGAIATLSIDIYEDGGIRPATSSSSTPTTSAWTSSCTTRCNRIRFEHPEVRTRGRHQRHATASSAPAPTSSCWACPRHAWKVNFCKFTNETRNGIEDSSRHSGLKFLAALQRHLRRRRLRAGAGLRRDRAGRRPLLRRVSLPEVPLLGVLPGTGGLTRVTDKRHVRRDLADVFCTTTEGVRGQRAEDWRLVDDIAKPQQFAAGGAASAPRNWPPRATAPPTARASR